MRTPENPIRLIIADDHKMVVDAMQYILERKEAIDVVAVCNTGDELLELIKHHEPHVVLMDISMPGLGAAEIARSVQTFNNPTKLIAVTMHLEVHLCDILIDDGFSGYIVKDDAFAELLDAIDEVLNSKIYFSTAIRNLRAINKEDGPQLSPRELECLKAAANGRTNSAIAKDLDITLRTVKYHFENILKKLKAGNRTEAIAIARKNHFIALYDVFSEDNR